MYSALWRILPGPAWVRVLMLILLFVLILFCLIEWVFPWVNTLLPAQEVTVDE
ncbi:MAG: hypothetical protein IT190_01870 [Microbacteriaceae bacterium]|nr:hypothetical protein [Microbacteriaceae bacterium]